MRVALIQLDLVVYSHYFIEYHAAHVKWTQLKLKNDWMVQKMSVLLHNNEVVLFQGDSITDTGRNRDNGDDLGKGYAMLIASWFNAKYPEKQVKFLNRGISGNRVVNLQSRWAEDCLELQPTWVSIYIG